jgi:hypothetical protein
MSSFENLLFKNGFSAGGRMSKAGYIQNAGFDKLTLTIF